MGAYCIMAKSAMGRLIKGLNRVVEKHTGILVLVLGLVVALAVSGNMFPCRGQEGLAEKHEIVYFHMDGCGHCKKFDPTWDAFSSKSDMPTRKVSADSGDPLLKSLGVSGFPTVLAVTGGGKKLEAFTDDRTEENLHAFAKKHKN